MSARLSAGAPRRMRGVYISRISQARKRLRDAKISNFPSTSNPVPNSQGAPPQPLPIDVDLTADGLAEANDKARRNRRKRIVDIEAEEASSSNNPSKRHRGRGNHINCEFYENLESEAYDSPVCGDEFGDPSYARVVAAYPLIFGDLQKDRIGATGATTSRQDAKTQPYGHAAQQQPAKDDSISRFFGCFSSFSLSDNKGEKMSW